MQTAQDTRKHVEKTRHERRLVYPHSGDLAKAESLSVEASSDLPMRAYVVAPLELKRRCLAGGALAACENKSNEAEVRVHGRVRFPADIDE